MGDGSIHHWKPELTPPPQPFSRQICSMQSSVLTHFQKSKWNYERPRPTPPPISPTPDNAPDVSFLFDS